MVRYSSLAAVYHLHLVIGITELLSVISWCRYHTHDGSSRHERSVQSVTPGTLLNVASRDPPLSCCAVPRSAVERLRELPPRMMRCSSCQGVLMHTLVAGAVALTRTADEEHLVILHLWRP